MTHTSLRTFNFEELTHSEFIHFSDARRWSFSVSWNSAIYLNQVKKSLQKTISSPNETGKHFTPNQKNSLQWKIVLSTGQVKDVISKAGQESHTQLFKNPISGQSFETLCCQTSP